MKRDTTPPRRLRPNHVECRASNCAGNGYLSAHAPGTLNVNIDLLSGAALTRLPRSVLPVLTTGKPYPFRPRLMTTRSKPLAPHRRTRKANPAPTSMEDSMVARAEWHVRRSFPLHKRLCAGMWGRLGESHVTQVVVRKARWEKGRHSVGRRRNGGGTAAAVVVQRIVSCHQRISKSKEHTHPPMSRPASPPQSLPNPKQAESLVVTHKAEQPNTTRRRKRDETWPATPTVTSTPGETTVHRRLEHKGSRYQAPP